LYIVESLLESPCIHSHVESFVKNVIAGVCYIASAERYCRCLLRWWIHTVKLSSKSNWYHMHLEEPRTLHAFEIGDM